MHATESTDDPGHADAADTRSGMVAVVGRTNVGKSTLVNYLLEEKVSIVSATVQTTRNVIRGILTSARGQIVFLDTPGVHRPEGQLGKVMNAAARGATDGVDVALLVLDRSERPWKEDCGWMRRLAKRGINCAFVLNKADLGRDHTAEYRAAWADAVKGLEQVPEPDWFTVSAETGRGTRRLLRYLYSALPAGPYLFPPDMLTDFPKRIYMADVIREKYIPLLKDELPHEIGVWIQDVIEEPNGAWTVMVRVYVQKPSQKGILLGRKGRVVKRVAAESAKELGETYGRPVKVELRVRAERNWDRNHWIMRQLGYVD